MNYDYDVWDTTWTRTRVGLVGYVYWFSARLTNPEHDERRAYSRGTGALTTSVEAIVAGLRIDVDGSLGYLDSSHDLFGGVGLRVGAVLWGALEGDVGYRWERMDASAGTNVSALTIRGPMASLLLRF